MTDICANLADSAIMATVPYATDPTSTIPSATCSCRTPHAALSGTTSSDASTPIHTPCGTTTVFWLPPWQLGPNAPLLPSPSTAVSDWLPTGSVATLSEALHRPAWSHQGGF